MRYLKSEAGQLALKDRALLPPRQRAAFILFDGRRSLSEVLEATTGMGITLKDIEQFVAQGLLVSASTAPSLSASAQKVLIPEDGALLPEQAGTVTDSMRYQRAYPLATELTAALGLRGFRLNLAVERAANLGDLMALTPKIREAVGLEKCHSFERALQT